LIPLQQSARIFCSGATHRNSLAKVLRGNVASQVAANLPDNIQLIIRRLKRHRSTVVEMPRANRKKLGLCRASADVVEEGSRVLKSSPR
jgi:hypothetical protein